jgi:hypothetical protein
MKKLLTATAFAAALLAGNLAQSVAAENAGSDGRGYDLNENSQADSLFLGYLDECREELKAKDNVGYNDYRDCALVKEQGNS